MKAQIYAGLGTLRELRWEGELEAIPLKGDYIVLDKDGDRGGYVDRVVHWIPVGKRKGFVEIYVR
jgi:hypothetical protein